MVKRRDLIVKSNVMNKNQLHSQLAYSYPSYRKFFGMIDSKSALCFWENYPSPEYIWKTKPIDDGRIYIIGSDGNYVLNPYDRSKNGKKADLEFVEDMLRKGENVDIKEINGEEYLVTYNTIQEIKGTGLGWMIVEITPVSVIRTSVTEAGMRLFFIGLGVLSWD